MKCQRCSGFLNSIPPSIAKGAKFGMSALVVGASAVLAKSVYELSLQVLKNGSPCPYYQFVALGCGVIATAYYSWQLVAPGAESKASERVVPRLLKAETERLPFSPGEFEVPKQIQEISAFHPGEKQKEKDDSWHEHS